MSHGAAVLVEVVVAEHRRDRCQRFQLAQDGYAAYVPGVDDMLAIRQRRVSTGVERPMGVRNDADAQHGDSLLLGR